MNFTWISQAIDALTTQYASLFLAEAQTWLHWLGIIILTAYALKWGLASVSSHGGYDLPGVVQFFAMYAIDAFMLAHYNTPLPWTHSTVASILPDTADQFAAMLNANALQICVQKFKDIQDHLGDAPSIITNTGAFVTWIQVMIWMQLAEAFMLLTNILGYLALGVLVLMGPIMIPFFIVPRLSWLFWNWVQAVLEFAFWRVVSTAIVFVWATAWGAFLDASIHGDYSLAHFSVLAIYMVAMGLGTIVTLVYLPAKLTSDLFKGTATAGSNWVTSAAIALRALG